MKKRFKVLIAAMCVLALAVTPAFAAWGDTSSGEMTATNQKIDGKGADRSIESFTLDGKFNYETLGNDEGKTTLTLSSKTLQDIVKNKLLPKWSGVAASVFRDQANQLVDLYGYEDNSGMMTQSGFDAYFNMSPGNNDKYKDEVWSCYSLKSKLAQTWATHAGDPGWDQLTVTGIRQVSNLSEARNMVGQALYDCENHKGVSAEEFLGVDEGGGAERLDALQDETSSTGFANVVTSVNCKGSSAEFDYVSFGIVFYDFEAVPVAAKGLTYVSGPFTEAQNEKGNNASVISNGQQQEIAHSAKLGDAVTETTSTTISAMAAAEVSENIGANIGWSETEFGEDTDVSADDDGISSSSSGWSEQTSMGLNWGAAWKMAGAAGVEQGHSTSKEVSKAVETTVLLPAHTAASINHTTTTTTYSQEYQQPVILSYKVAIYAVSGDFSSAGSGGINGPSYDKQSLVIKFDTKDDASPTYGCAATDDLYSRVITNKRVNGYDVAGGRTYSTHCDKGAWRKSEDIDWDNVISTARSYYGVEVAGVAKANYFYETAGKLNVDKDKTSSEVGSIYPLYGLAKVKTPKSKYVLYLGDTLSREALGVTGYNKFDVPFYGFNPKWGEWNRCDENGTIINGGNLKDDDPLYVVDGDTLAPTPNTRGGTVYLTWKIEDPDAKPKTGESPDGQNLAAANIESPVVQIDVRDAAFDNPSVTAEGSYTGFYGTPVDLNKVINYEVTDANDKIIETQVKWESREPNSYGITVNAGSGIATFEKPGTYHVRPYVVNNNGQLVYSDWITITAAVHDLQHYAALAPTCTTDGCIDHYKCADCGKYFSDANGTIEIPEASILVAATGHAWGDWNTTKRVSGDTPGEQQRVCGNDASHVETRALYAVQFNMNGHGTAPAEQTVASGASVTVPEEPTAAGYTFGGWFTDKECTKSYDFGTTVEGNLTLYASWSPAKYMVAAVAVGDVYKDEAGEQKVYPFAQGSIEIDGGSLVTDEDGYTYSYKEVESGAPITLTVKPYENYGLKNIKAATVNAKAVTGDSFTPKQESATTYSLTVSDADVAVVASFGQVTVTYDGNAPAGAMAYNVPKPQAIACGGTPKKTLDPSASGENGEAYLFKGWYTDSECTKAYTNEPLSKDTTLFAKWEKTDKDLHTVTYTLFDVAGADPASYEVSYKVAAGSTAYDPTDELYAIAGDDVKYGYDLKKYNEARWFTNTDCTEAYNFESTVTADVHLYAQIVPKKFNVSFFDGVSSTAFLTAPFDYNTAIGTLPKAAPTRTGYTLSGWTTQDGKDWDLAKTPVVGNMNLYAKWTAIPYTVTFNDNAPGDAEVSNMPAAKQVDYGSAVEEPAKPSDTTGKYKFEGWYKEASCTNAWVFETDTVADVTQLYAKWTVNSYNVTFEMQGHGTAVGQQSIRHGEKATSPEAPSEQGYDFGGWFTSTDGGTTLSENAFNFDMPITADTTLYAKWTKRAYNVIVSDDLSNGVITPSSTTATQGATVTLTVAPNAQYGLKSITVTPTAGGSDAFTPVKVAANTYTFTMPYSNVTVSAEFAQITVSFNENAPTGTTVANAPVKQTIGYGDAPAQPNPVPAATGAAASYTFVGWCLDAACTKPYLFTPLKADTTLFAKWVQDGGSYHNVTYTLYDVPGSSPASYSVTDTVADNATAYNPTADLLALIPDNPGYHLYADASGNTWFIDTYCTQPYDFAAKVNSDIQLYAKIIPDSFVVQFYRDKINGVVKDFVDAKSMNYGTSIGNSAPKLTKDGYTFTGWKDDATNSDWNLSTAITKAVTLYATWTANKYTVTFAENAPSGVNVAGMPSKQTIVYGVDEKATQPEESPTATGYTFGGWFSDVACTEQYNFDNKVDRDLTLFAKWEIENFEVAFDTNGAGTGPNTQIVSYGNQATDPGALTLAGYTFGGWCTSTDGGTTLSETPFDFSTPITENTDLYAKWTIDVTFDANGHGTAPEKQSVASGSKVSVPQEPTATGYVFGGWFTDKACTIAYDFANEKVTQPLTLYAKWIANEYTVTFNANGHGTAPAKQTVKHGEKATEPTALAADGFIFGGWFTDAACTAAYDFAAPVKADLKLFAKWTPAASTVTFDANGHGTAPAAQTVKQGEKAAKPADLAADGFTFGGWFTDKNCTTAYDFDAAVTGNLTLYAKWTAKQDISDAQVTLSQTSFVYDYTAKEPTVTVKLGDKELSGDDYTVAYEYNVEVGLAAVIVTGKGDYSGQALAAFEITSPAHAARTYMADLDANAWYMSRESGVGAFQGTDTLFLDHVIAKGLMSGYKDAKGNVTGFGPNDELERCQAAVIIYRMANPDSTDTTDAAAIAATRNTSGLADVPDGEYFTAAVNWAVENGVITGYKDANGKVIGFGPHEQITREQLATIIGRFMDPQGTAGKDVSAFKDASSISDWAAGGVAYCNSKGIMTGIGDSGNFAPQEHTLRCQMAKVIAVTDRLFNAEVNTQASAAPATTEMPPASTGGLLPGAAAL